MKLSIVIICLNEQRHLARCLDAIFNADHADLTIEVIVADGGSTDSTLDIARSYNVKIVHSPRGIPRQRNAGGWAATGDLLAYVDSDVQLLPGWFAAVQNNFSGDRKKIVGSAAIMPENVSWIARAYALHRCDPNIESPSNKNEVERYLSTQSLVMGRNVFEQVGGFREDLFVDEDTEFILQAKNLGIPLWCDQKLAYIHHGEPPSAKAFFQRVKWGANYKAWYISIIRGQWSKILRMQYIYGVVFAGLTGFLLAALVLGSLCPTRFVIPLILGLLAASIVLPGLRLSIKRKDGKHFHHYCAMYAILGAANAVALLGFGANKARRWR